ncbi:Acid phosphatase 1 [Bienertia sinuspersici]
MTTHAFAKVGGFRLRPTMPEIGPIYPTVVTTGCEKFDRFAKTVNLSGDGKDVWIFDVDDTLLSFLPYCKIHGFGIQVLKSKGFRNWGMQGKVPALQASLSLYNQLRQLGFTIILLTGRPEYLRNMTNTNLHYAGYTNWERLILREPFDEGISALEYKSGRRKQLEDEGYRIHGCSGDQWSDLLGYPMARRTFKLPNPMYYAP